MRKSAQTHSMPRYIHRPIWNSGLNRWMDRDKEKERESQQMTIALYAMLNAYFVYSNDTKLPPKTI